MVSIDETAPAPSSTQIESGVSSKEDAAGAAVSSVAKDNDIQIAKLQQQINRLFAIGDHKSAAPICEELVKLTTEKYNELHDECAEPYVQYATALMEVAREENQLISDNNMSAQPPAPESTDTTSLPPAVTINPDGVREQEEEDDEEGEDVPPLQLAWEVLEVARIIYSREETPEAYLNVAKVTIKLGEILIEDEKLEEAVKMFEEAIEYFKKGGEESDSREISSTYYMIGLAYSLHQNYKLAIESYDKCCSIMQSQIDKLEDKPENENKIKSLNELLLEITKLRDDCKDSEKQLSEYRKHVPLTRDPKSSDGASSSSSSNNNVSNRTAAVSTVPVKAVSSSSSSNPFMDTSSSSNPFADPEFGVTTSSVSSSNGNVTSTVTNISHLVRKRAIPAKDQVSSSTEEIKSKARTVSLDNTRAESLDNTRAESPDSSEISSSAENKRKLDSDTENEAKRSRN